MSDPVVTETITAPGNPPAGNPPAGNPPAGETPQPWAAPEWVPEAARGKDLNETFEKFGKHYADEAKRFEGMRQKLAAMPKPPEKPDAYTFEPAETLKDYFTEDTKPVVDAFKAVAHKHGVTDAQFAPMINEFYQSLQQAGGLPPAFNAKNEVNYFAKLNGLSGQSIGQEWEKAKIYGEGLAEQLAAKLPQSASDGEKDAVRAVALSLTETGAGIQVLRMLSESGNDIGIAIGGTGGTQAMSDDEALKAVGDPRYDTANRNHLDPAKRFDPDFRKRVDAALARIDAKKNGGR